MKTKLKIKSSYPDDEVDINVKIRELTDSITEQESSIEHVMNEKYNILCPVFVIEYENHSELKNVITKLNEHRYVPFDGFEEIGPTDYSISLESDDINESFEHLNEKNLSYVEEQVNMLDYIASDIVSEQEDLKEKVDALYSFMQKSGILYYKQLVEGLLDVMHQNGLVDKDKIEKQIFSQVH